MPRGRSKKKTKSPWSKSMHTFFAKRPKEVFVENRPKATRQ